MLSKKIESMIRIEENTNNAIRSRQLINFIDSALANAYMFEGHDRAKTLVTALLTMRDYLAKDSYENSSRDKVLEEIVKIIEIEENKEKSIIENNDTPQKKELKSKIQTEQEESI